MQIKLIILFSKLFVKESTKDNEFNAVTNNILFS